MSIPIFYYTLVDNETGLEHIVPTLDYMGEIGEKITRRNHPHSFTIVDYAVEEETLEGED